MFKKRILIITIIVTITILFSFLYLKTKPSKNNLSIKETETITVNNEEIKVSKDINLNQKQEEYNPDIVGRLEIPNLFNILIVQSKDNNYYLNHSINKKKDSKGTEFMDYRVTPDAKQINIYGHNSHTYNLPFHQLENYLNEEFFNKNKYLIFQTYSIRRTYQIIAVKIAEDDKEHLIVDTTGSSFVNHLNKLLANSIYLSEVNYDENSNILVLQTCSYNKLNSYLLLIAIEIKS